MIEERWLRSLLSAALASSQCDARQRQAVAEADRAAANYRQVLAECRARNVSERAIQQVLAQANASFN